PWRDSVLFSSTGVDLSAHVLKYGSLGEMLFTANFTVASESCGSNTLYRSAGMIPDSRGGVFFLSGCHDSIYHVEDGGNVRRQGFPGIGTLGGYVFDDGHGGLVSANDTGFAQRWDSSGNPLWGNPLVYQIEPETTYIKSYSGD